MAFLMTLAEAGHRRLAAARFNQPQSDRKVLAPAPRAGVPQLRRRPKSQAAKKDCRDPTPDQASVLMELVSVARDARCISVIGTLE